MLARVKDITLDGVFINVSYKASTVFDIRRTLHDFQGMGIIVHINMDALELDVADKVIGSLGLFKVVSYGRRADEAKSMILMKL